MDCNYDDLLETIFYKLHGETQSCTEASFYWEKLFERVEQIADPKFSKNEVSDHLYGIAAPMSRAEQLHGWKLGVAFGLQLSSEAINPQFIGHAEVEQTYYKVHRTLISGDTSEVLPPWCRTTQFSGSTKL